jgi:hypothetical protein
MTDTIEHAGSRPDDPPPDGRKGAAGPAGPDAAARRPGQGRRTALLVAALVAVAGGIPLAVALGVLHHPRWYPLLDLAQTELRVRDVGTRHSPLVGLAGRFDGFGMQGSHLGPLSFWSLRPFYTVFGGSAWALQAASACLNLLAMAVAIWIAHRRGGPRAALAAAVGLAVLARAYGAGWLTEAWNPYMPMLWWVVFLLAVWSVVCDDLPLLPVAVFAGSFCMQTHIPYLGLVGGMAAFTVAAVAWWLWPRRRDPAARRELLRWGGPSLALLVLLWVPPVIDLLVNDPSNVAIVRESFATRDELDPPEHPVALGRAVEIWTANLDLRVLVDRVEDARDTASGGISEPGLVVLAMWLMAAGLAWWRLSDRRYDAVRRLHLVVAVALALGLVSITRIYGTPWYYLVLWSLGTTTLLLATTVWTALLAWQTRVAGATTDTTVSATATATATAADDDATGSGTGPGRAVRSGPLGLPLTRGTAALVALLVVAGTTFTWDAAHSEVPAAHESRTLRLVAPRAIRALRSGDVPGGGEDGRYLVRWEDTLGIGSQGYGFLLELERQGFDVGVPRQHRTGAVAHRVRELDEATATVNYVNGQEAIARWDRTPGAERVAHLDPRSPAERARFERLRDGVVAGLRAAGLDDLVPTVDRNLFIAGLDPRMPTPLADKVARMMDLGLPTAVYVAPAAVG